MIGNDVIDLNLANTQSNWRRKGYLDKIFTCNEQEFISKCSNPDVMVWTLWSRKEAVYKILIQQGEKKGYFPIKIECLDINLEIGKVRFDSELYYTKTILSKSNIHSIAVTNLSDFEKINSFKKGTILKKIETIPYVYLNQKCYSASKSHHGNFEEIVWLQS